MAGDVDRLRVLESSSRFVVDPAVATLAADGHARRAPRPSSSRRTVAGRVMALDMPADAGPTAQPRASSAQHADRARRAVGAASPLQREATGIALAAATLGEERAIRHQAVHVEEVGAGARPQAAHLAEGGARYCQSSRSARQSSMQVDRGRTRRRARPCAACRRAAAAPPRPALSVRGPASRELRTR